MAEGSLDPVEESAAADGPGSLSRVMPRTKGFSLNTNVYALDRRPILLEGFRDGRLSYSVLRTLARLEHTDQDTDEAFVTLAATEGVSVYDVERMVRNYMLYLNQHLPPGDPDRKRKVTVRKIGDGLGRVTITLSESEIEEFLLALKSFDDPPFRAETANSRLGNESAAADLPTRRQAGTRALVTEEGEPLHLGRKTREWTTAQRRAVTIRDGGHCCGYHRSLIHRQDFRVDGDPNHEPRFTRRDGTPHRFHLPVSAVLLATV